MFDLKRPCVNCPFRKGQGPRFGFPRLRLMEFFTGVAFQCHKTIDYDNWDDDEKRQGKRPQQCAGLMSILVREHRPNNIMQIAMRTGHFDPSKLDHRAVYKSIRSAVAAHQSTRLVRPKRTKLRPKAPAGERSAPRAPLQGSP